jgi:hypothetical protein
MPIAEMRIDGAGSPPAAVSKVLRCPFLMLPLALFLFTHSSAGQTLSFASPSSVAQGSSGTLTLFGSNLRDQFTEINTACEASATQARVRFLQGQTVVAEVIRTPASVQDNQIAGIPFDTTVTANIGFYDIDVVYGFVVITGSDSIFVPCFTTNTVDFQVFFPGAQISSVTPNIVNAGSSGTLNFTGTDLRYPFEELQCSLARVVFVFQESLVASIPVSQAQFTNNTLTNVPFGTNVTSVPRELDVFIEWIGTNGSGGSCAETNWLPFTVAPAPVCPPFRLLSINPSVVAAGAGSLPATISTNANFGAYSAQIRWTSGSQTTTLSASGPDSRQISFTIPASLLAQPGFATISVTLNTSLCQNISSENSVGIEIVESPQLSSVSPPSAEVGSGALTLTLNGSRFQSGDVLRWEFEGVQFSFSTNFVSPSQLTAAVPADRFARTGIAFLSIQRGSVASGSVPFPIVERLRITSLNPASVIAGSGPFTLRVTGSGFDQLTRIRFGTTTFLVIFVSPSELTVSIPGDRVSQPGVVLVTAVSSSPPRESNTVEFRVERALRITSINPNGADEGSGPVTLGITGAGFASGAQAFLGATALATTFGSATQLTATIPASALDQPATLEVTVRNPDGETSNAVPFTVRPVFRLESISPPSAIAGQPAFQLTLAGRGFLNGAGARWNGASLNTTFVSRTTLTAQVPAALIADPGFASVAVVNPTGVASNTLRFTIESEPLTLTSVSPPSALLGSGALTVTLSGTGFRPGASAFWNATALASQFVSRTQLTATVPAGLLTELGPKDIRVGNPDGQFSGPAQFLVTLPPLAIDLTGLAPTPLPTQPTSVGVQLGAAAPVHMTGTLELRFNPNAAAFPPSTENRQLVFAAGGKTIEFSIAAGQQTASIPNGGAIQQGTVAGTISVVLTRLQSGAFNLLREGEQIIRTVQVPRLPPVIVPASVRFVNVTASGFEVEFTAYSTPRDLTSVQLSFAGTNLEGPTTFDVPVAQAAAAYFDSEEGRANGSLFRGAVRFELLSGAITAIQSVTARVTNSVGASEPVTGTR